MKINGIVFAVSSIDEFSNKNLLVKLFNVIFTKYICKFINTHIIISPVISSCFIIIIII